MLLVPRPPTAAPSPTWADRTDLSGRKTADKGRQKDLPDPCSNDSRSFWNGLRTGARGRHFKGVPTEFGIPHRVSNEFFGFCWLDLWNGDWIRRRKSLRGLADPVFWQSSSEN